MKYLFWLMLSAAVLAACSRPSNPGKEVYNADFKWTITIPEGFENVDAEEWARMQGKGSEALENATGQEIVNLAKDIFVVQSGRSNYLEANYQPFDEAVDGSYAEANKAVNGLLYETFISQMPGIKIDSATTTETISGLKFKAMKMKIIYPNNATMFFEMHSRLFDKREFTVNIIYVDEKKGDQMRDAWTKSKFDK